MLNRKVHRMWRGAVLCIAGWASITVGATLAQETPPLADANAPHGALVFYLTDDPPPARSAHRRVLRLLQLLGMHGPEEPARFSVQNEAETDMPARSAATADPPRELAAVVAVPNGHLTTPLAEKTPHALPPLPPLRIFGSALTQTLPPEHHAVNSGDSNLRPLLATAPPTQNTSSNSNSRPTPETGDPTPDSIAASAEPRSQDAVLEPQSTLVVKTLPVARDGVDEELTKRSVTVAFACMELPPLERKSSERISPTVPPQTVATSRRQPNKAGGPAPNAATLTQPVNTLRDRSPVAMTARPNGISRQSPTSALTPTSELTSGPTPSQFPLPEPPQFLTPSPLLELRGTEERVAAAEPPHLSVAVREGRLLRTPENVVRVVPEHDRFCDVLVFNPREVAVIGKKQGTVRVELWYDQQGLKRATYLVAVDGQANSETPEADLQKIEQLIAYLFPASRVKLVHEQDRLIVRGLAVNPRQAVEIMSTVRRSQLIPVVDEIVVQPQAN